MIKHFGRHPDDLERCGLSGPYCGSWYRLRVSGMDPAVLQKIITKMAGGDAVHGTPLAGSGGFQHGRVYQPAERKVRQARREAVCTSCTRRAV